MGLIGASVKFCAAAGIIGRFNEDGFVGTKLLWLGVRLGAEVVGFLSAP